MWKTQLAGFYDVEYIIDGITHGFYIGIDDTIDNIDEKLCKDNLYIELTNKQRDAITKWILKGHRKGYIVGPFDKDFVFPWPVHVSPLFVVPKPGNNNWRTIAHLSFTRYPWQYSVNDCILESEKTVKYITFKEIVHMMYNAGKNAYMFAMDALDAYYRVPIHESQYKYMGIKWKKKLWLFISLQMGLASAPRIYTRFGDAVEYIVVKNNTNIAYINNVQSLRHYIDDYFGVACTYERAKQLYDQLRWWFDKLGIPTQDEKCTPPAMIILILGWIWNSKKLEVQLPNKKQKKALKMLKKLLNSLLGEKKFFEKLDGLLQHISLVVFPGKAFLRRFEMMIYDPTREYGENIKIDEFLLEDIRWWIWVLEKKAHVQAKYEFLLKKPSEADLHIWTDAASTIGLGGKLGKKSFQIKWEDTIKDELEAIRGPIDIQVQEYLGSIVAVKLWLDELKGKSVAIYNDNPGAAGAIISKAPRLHRLDMQYLTRELAKLAVEKKFYFWGVKVDGKDNNDADSLSRFKDDVKHKLATNELSNECQEKVKSIVNYYMRGLMKHPLNGKVHKDWNFLTKQKIEEKRRLYRRKKNSDNSTNEWNILSDMR